VKVGRSSVSPSDLEVLHAVQHQVHPGDGGDHVVALLPEKPQPTVLAAAALHMRPVPQVGS
jgi:hypothetical protein